MYQTCFTSVAMWMKQKDTSTVQEKQKDTSTVQEKQKGTSTVQEKLKKYIESNPAGTTNTFLLSSEI